MKVQFRARQRACHRGACVDLGRFRYLVACAFAAMRHVSCLAGAGIRGRVGSRHPRSVGRGHRRMGKACHDTKCGTRSENRGGGGRGRHQVGIHDLDQDRLRAHCAPLPCLGKNGARPRSDKGRNPRSADPGPIRLVLCTIPITGGRRYDAAGRCHFHEEAIRKAMSSIVRPVWLNQALQMHPGSDRAFSYRARLPTWRTGLPWPPQHR